MRLTSNVSVKLIIRPNLDTDFKNGLRNPHKGLVFPSFVNLPFLNYLIFVPLFHYPLRHGTKQETDKERNIITILH